MNSGWAVVIGAVIALIGSAVVPWLVQRSARKAEDERNRRRVRGEAIGTIVEGWYAIADLDFDAGKLFEDQIDEAAKVARRGMTTFATALHPGEADVYRYVQWITVDAIIDAPEGRRIGVVARASARLYQWHWGEVTAATLGSEVNVSEPLYRERGEAGDPL